LRPEVEWAEMRERHRRGESISKLAKEFGVTRNTIRKYVKATEPPRYVLGSAKPSLLDPFKPYIDARLAEFDISARRIFRELQGRGYPGGYGLVKRYVRPIKQDRAVRAEIRFETKPGEQAQVDWIDLGRHEVEGEVVHLYCFTLVLGYSRYAYAEFTDNVRTETFIQCHLNGFQYIDGLPQTILYDNTKNVVLRRALKSSESTFNPLYSDFARHHGITPRLCRPGIEGAKTKGKVERFIQYLQRDFFIGRPFESLNDLNSQLILWLAKANDRVHGTTHAVPSQRLKEEMLRPLDPTRPYIVTLVEFRKVTRDCFVSYQGSKYSVPWQYAGRECQLHVRFGKFEVMVDGGVVARHETVPGSRTVRVREHFAGLYKLKRDENLERHRKRMGVVFDPVRIQAPEVQVREPSYYEQFMEETNDDKRDL